jgi:hypothetical protein
MGEVDTRVAPIDCMMPLDVDRVAVSPADDPGMFPVRPENRGAAAYFFSRAQGPLLAVAQHYYPQAKTEAIINIDGDPHLWAVIVPPALIDRQRGLVATFRYGPRVQSTAGLDALQCADCPDFPVETTAEGIVLIPSPGRYGLRVTRGSVELDGRPVAADGTADLYAGWHELRVRTTLGSTADTAFVEWKAPDATEWSRIPRAHLNTHPAAHGLLGRYYDEALPLDPPTPSTATPQYTKLDPALSFDWGPEFDEAPRPGFAAKPSTMEWVGTVNLDEGRTHTVRLETTAATRVFVDGKEVIATEGGYPATRDDAVITGHEGRVPILVRTTRAANDTTYFWWLRLHWSQPGGSWTAFADYKPPHE